MQEGGIFQYWKLKIQSKVTDKNNAEMSKNELKNFSLSDVKSIFTVWLCGICLTVCVLQAELAIHVVKHFNYEKTTFL